MQGIYMKGFFEETIFENYSRYGDNGVMVPNYFKNSQDSYILRCAKKIYAIKYGGGFCVGCKIDDPIILSFHHKDPLDKTETISNIIRGNASDCSKKALELEVGKCELRCGNCHAEVHCEDRSVSKNELLRIIGGVDFCTKCGYQSGEGNISSLHFHHLDGFEKKFEISEVYSRTSKRPSFHVPIEEIKEELKKCVVICKNCHTVQHAHYERYMRLKPLIYAKSNEWSEKQNEFEKSGKTRVNIFENKKNKRYDRKHKSNPKENPYGIVDNASSRDKIEEELEKRLLNI